MSTKTETKTEVVSEKTRTPAVGRIVMFASEGHTADLAVPAIITGVNNATNLDLTVFLRGVPATYANEALEGPANGDKRRWWWPVY